MRIIKSTRIESIDILRGVVMVIMALDHVRDYFNYGSFFGDPTNMETTTPFLFFTRFITHYCAPVFIFLAGTAAFLYGNKKTTYQLFKFLFTRGLWLMFLEVVVNNFLWFFDPTYSLLNLQVIWTIGLTMVVLSFLIYLPRKVILITGIIIIIGHNLLDGIIMEGTSISALIWYTLHQKQFLILDSNQIISMAYPIIPWIGVITLGYSFGVLYQKNFDVRVRKKCLLYLGIGTIIMFFIVRGFNIYGDLVPWNYQKNITYTILSFFNVTKYPPSLVYVLITLGPAMLFLYSIESIKNKLSNFFLVFGRVPLFYYFLHIFVIHCLAVLGIVINGGNWRDMIFDAQSFLEPKLLNYGYSLFVVYIIWIAVVLLLYPFCKKYMKYKANNKDKWWLSYL